MKRSSVIALIVISMGCSAASGADNTFTGNTNNNWNVGNNWSQTSVPDETDRVVIPATKTCNVDITTAVADTIEIASTGHLVIQASKKLTLDNDANVDSVINGDLVLEDGGENASGTLEIVDHNHVVSGSGFIQGGSVYCHILIEMNKVFQSELANASGGIRGGMKFLRDDPLGTAAPGYFNNFGTVIANGGQTIWFASSVELDDQTDAEWKVSGYPSIMQFDRAATGLSGNFRLACYTFLFNANVATCGTFEYDIGILDFENSSTFKYATFDAGSSCGNPKVSGIGSCVSPTSPFVVGPTDVNCSACSP